MQSKITIELKSDMCTSSGDSFGSSIDNDVCYDEYGIPYIPAKRIKGIFREEAEEFFPEEKNRIEEIFGMPNRKNSGSLKIDNAYIANYEAIINDINKVPQDYKKYMGMQRILNTYTYTRYQTAIDENTGTSKDNLLRSTRVVKKGNIFFSLIEIDNDDFEFLQKVAKLVTHMGLNRTRGYGEVKCKIVSNEEVRQDLKNSLSDELDKYGESEEVEIKLLLKTESEIMVSKQNAESSTNYISGSNILGAIAQKYIEEKKPNFETMDDTDFINLFLKNKVKYSNAYISNQDAEEFYPIPASYTKVKNEAIGVYYNKMFDVTKEDIQLSTIKNKFVTFDENNYVKEVEMNENYHHQRSQDKKYGHVAKVDNGGTLYQYNVIAKGQYFLTTIIGSKENLTKIASYIEEGELLRVGKSRNTEYGKLRIEKTEVCSNNKEKKPYSKFAVILTSDVIIMENGNATTDKSKLVDKLKELLGQEIVEERAFINFDKASGYNVLWNLPKEQLEAFKAGSCLVFTSANPIQVCESYIIGARQNEGYGNIRIMDLSNKNEILKLQECSEVLNEKNLPELANSLKELLKRTINNAIKEEILAVSMKNTENTYGLNNTTIGRLMLMLEQAKSTGDFMKNVKSIKDPKKLGKVMKLLNGRETAIKDIQAIKDLSQLNMQTAQVVTKIKGTELYIEENEYDQYVMEYIKQSLLQVKIYALKENKKGGVK